MENPINPKIYGQVETTEAPVSGEAAVQPYVAPQPVASSAAMSGSPLIQQGQARLQANNREEAGAWASMGAAMTQWGGVKVWDWLTQEHFPPVKGYDPTSILKSVKYELDDDSLDHLLKARSPQEAQQRLRQIEDQRMAYEAMGDSPIVSFVTSAVDPTFLGLDVGAIKIARAARAAYSMSNNVGRLTAAGTATVGTYALGKIEQQVSPVGEGEIVANALLNGAATGLFFSGGKLKPRDENFPANELQKPAREMQAGVDDALDAEAIRREAAGPYKAPDAPAPTAPDPKDTPIESAADVKPALSRELAGAKPRYSYGSKQFTLKFASDIDRAAYITAQKTPSKRDADYVKFVADATGMDAAQVRAHGAKVRDAIKAQAKDAEAGTLSVTDMGHLYGAGKKRAAAPGTPAFRFSVESARENLAKIAQGKDKLLARLAARMNELLPEDVEVRVTDKKNLLDGSREFYDDAARVIYVSADSTPQRRLHEIAHSMTVGKLKFGEANPTSVHGKVSREIEDLRAQVQRMYDELPDVQRRAIKNAEYYLKNKFEFVAGLYEGRTEFAKFLRQVSPEKGAPILTRFVNSIRRLLGLTKADDNAFTRALGLSDELMASPIVREADPVGPVKEFGSPPEWSTYGAPPAPGTVEPAMAQKLAKNISISLHKTLSQFGKFGQEIADLLVADPLSKGKVSVADTRTAIRHDLTRAQRAYMDRLMQAMGEQGVGRMQMVLARKKARDLQVAIERDVATELQARARQAAGLPYTGNPTPTIKELADLHGEVMKQALEEMKRSGVKGADEVAENAGYFNRRWDNTKVEALRELLVQSGRSAKEADDMIRDMVSRGMQRGSQMTPETADEVAAALLERARAKSYFEDSAFNIPRSADELAAVRKEFIAGGMSGARVDRIMEVLKGQMDEGGKLSHLKGRIDIAMDESISVGGRTVSLADLVDTNLASIMHRYLDRTAATSAFARHGYGTASELQALRRKYLSGIDNEAKRAEAAKYFDGTVNLLHGNPVGEDMNRYMQISAGLTQMVGLAYSGLWQFTDYALAMSNYGAAATMRHFLKEMPVLRNIMDSPKELTHLRNVLAANAIEDLRLRPFLDKMEDGFYLDPTDQMRVTVHQSKQLVPYVNGMRYIQEHQARVVANLVVDTFDRAAKGDAKAVEVLQKYGLESHTMGNIAADIKQHGMDMKNWSPATWEAVRVPLGKMMDESVLKARIGEIPAFAQMTQTGRFIFTFRSFVLGAHNKVLSGTLNNSGFGGLGLLMAYQFPLTMLATGAMDTLTAKDKTDRERYATALTQMSSMGLLGELVGVAFGTKEQFGSPGSIMWDRGYKLGSTLANSVSSGLSGEGWNMGNVGAAAVGVTPLLSAFTPARALGEYLKED